MILSRLERAKLDSIKKILTILREKTKNFAHPAVDQIVSEFGHDPFLILISCLLSLRTRDVTSVKVSRLLFKRAKTPNEVLSIPQAELEKLLHPIGFFRVKARTIKSVSHELIERFNGLVPQTEQELLSIKGVGQKTAHAVLGYAFNIPAICVDTHVHQLANRLGWVKTKNANQTEKVLRTIIPEHNWIELNYLLVTWGQNICTPVSPLCSRCAIAQFCPRVGVVNAR